MPLSQGGTDFIALLRKGQPRHVRWAGKPYKDEADGQSTSLEPRASFKVWSEIVAGRCRLWTDEQLETAGMLALVYGKVHRASNHLSVYSPESLHHSSLRSGVGASARRKGPYRQLS